MDMSFAQPLIVAYVHNWGNFYWVFRLLLIAPTREYICVKFDPLCDRPCNVGANQEEVDVVDLRRHSTTAAAGVGKVFGCLRCLCICNRTPASSFIRHIDGVSSHPACLLILHCALS